MVPAQLRNNRLIHRNQSIPISRQYFHPPIVLFLTQKCLYLRQLCLPNRRQVHPNDPRVDTKIVTKEELPPVVGGPGSGVLDGAVEFGFAAFFL